MRRILKTRHCICIALLSITSPSTAADKSTNGFQNRLRRAMVEKAQTVERLPLSARMEHYKVPGVSVAIIEGCRIVEMRGFGVATDHGKAIRPDTLFQAASISKPVAAIGAMRLVEQGRLSLDADVRTRLKSWALPDSLLLESHPVTLRGLLSHGAGLTVHGFGGYEIGVPLPDVTQILDGLLPANSPAVRIEAAPGTRWRYSGGGYVLTQLMMTEASGRPFPELMRDLVLAPAGMADSTYMQPLSEVLSKRAAVGHLADGTAVKGKWHVYPELAAAGLWTTSADLARLAIAVMQAEKGKASAVIGTSTTHEMLKTQIGPWGLGFRLGGAGKARSFSHGGANEGYRAQLIAYPDTCQGAAIMTNSDAGDTLIEEILRAIGDTWHWPEERKSLVMERAAITPGIIARFVGDYQVKGMTDVRFGISLGRDGLILTLPGGTREALQASTTGLFSPDSGTLVKANDTIPAAGAVTLSDAEGNGYEAERIPPK